MKILRFLLSLSLLALGWAGPRLCAQAPAAAAGYDVAVTKNVMVAMRDGVRLATDIYLPARNGVPVEGKFPVILERTPYTKERPAASNRVFVAHGYVVVCQDVRGRYASEGRWRPLRDDGRSSLVKRLPCAFRPRTINVDRNGGFHENSF